MKLYLIRHGETDWNRRGLLQGQQDIPLNENGVALAENTAKGMQKKKLCFDKIYSSPLLRAFETAQIISDYLTGGRVPVISDDRLKEMDFKRYEGQIYQGLALDSFTKLSGIEPFEEVRDRTMDLVRQIVADPANEGKHILISTHGVALQSIMAGVYGGTLPAGRGVNSNCGVTILTAEVACDGSQMIFAEKENVIYY